MILGIDPGSRVTGYAFVDERTKGKPRVMEFGVLRVPEGQVLVQRLSGLIDQLEPLLKEYSPDILSMEESFFARNARTAMVLGHARGALMVCAHRAGCAVHEYPPASIKEAVSGSGRASKEQVARMVAHLFGLAAVPQLTDASDALAAAWAYIHFTGRAALARG